MIKILVILFLFSACATHPKITPAIVATTSPSKVESSGVLATVPFTLHDNRMLVSVNLNSQGPFMMIFDTGAANTLTPETMNILELKSQGPDMGLSANARRAGKNTVHIRSVDLGGHKLQDQKFAVTNLSNIRKAFKFSHLDGVIGAEFLQATRVRIDFDRDVIQFLSENAPEMAGAGKVNFDLFGEKPVIEGRINSKKARIVIDTGDRSNLTLFRRFARRSKLDKIFINRDEITTGMGSAGPIPGKLASVQSVGVAGFEVKDVLARLPMTNHGYFFSAKVSASAGVGLLKGFNLEIDMKKQTLALQARANYREESTFVPVRKIKR